MRRIVLVIVLGHTVFSLSVRAEVSAFPCAQGQPVEQGVNVYCQSELSETESFSGYCCPHTNNGAEMLTYACVSGVPLCFYEGQTDVEELRNKANATTEASSQSLDSTSSRSPDLLSATSTSSARETEQKPLSLSESDLYVAEQAIDTALDFEAANNDAGPDDGATVSVESESFYRSTPEPVSYQNIQTPAVSGANTQTNDALNPQLAGVGLQANDVLDSASLKNIILIVLPFFLIFAARALTSSYWRNLSLPRWKM